MGNFLISPFAPWVIAAAFLLAGIALWVAAGRRQRRVALRLLRGVAVIAVLLGLLLTAGAGYTAVRMAAVLRAHPAPGKLVAVAGRRLHVWCEGPATAQRLLLLPGGYGQALWFRHLQRALAGEYRVCLVDRSGLGWSDRGSGPISVEGVVRELRAALAAAGETFPLVIVGHSFGGMYAANFAAMHRPDVAGIVLLDPTAPSHMIAMANSGCPGPSYVTLLGAMFGLGFNRTLNPMFGPAFDDVRPAIGEDWDTLVALEIRPSALLGSSSALGAGCRPLSFLPATPGRLGDLPLLEVIQSPLPESGRPAWLANLTDFEYANHKALFDAARDDYLRMSSRSRLVYAPAGAGHNFPHSHREFTLAQIRGFMQELAGGEPGRTPAAGPAS